MAATSYKEELGKVGCTAAFADCGALDGSWSLVAGTAEGDLVELALSGSKLRSAHVHDGAVLSMAVSPAGDAIASCGRDKAARLCKTDGLRLDASPAEFALPPRCVAFSTDGERVAFAGEDETIRVCDALTGRLVYAIPHTRRPIKSVALDPVNKYVALAEEDGTVSILQACDEGERVALLPALATPAAAGDPTPVSIDWRPGDGSLLAVPARGHVSFIDRTSFKEAFAVQSDSGSLSKYGLVRWSPNGLILAAAGAGQTCVCLHDMRPGAKGRELRIVDALAPICSASWHPDANTLAMCTSEGNLSLWNACVPEDECPEPYVPLDQLSRADLYVGGDNEEDVEDAGDDEEKDMIGTDATGNETAEMVPDTTGAGKLVYGGGLGGTKRAGAVQNAVMQKPFQPGSTGNSRAKQQRFMAYDLNGFLVQRSDGSTDSVLVETNFHDASRLRVPAIAGADEYSIGALGPHGVALAGKDHLWYRPFNAWSPDAEWHATLPHNEKTLCVSVGTSFIALATNAHLLRLFCVSGLQLHIGSIDGPPICACAHDNLLGLIWHSSSPLTDATAVRATQQLQFCIIDTSSLVEVSRGPVALSAGAHLCWAGFATTGYLCTYDSEGAHSSMPGHTYSIRNFVNNFICMHFVGTMVLSAGVVRMRTNTLGGSWIPIFRSKDNKETVSESHWVVGVTESEVVYTVCTPGEGEPSVSPRPVHSVKEVELPLATADGTVVSLENQFALEHARLLEVQAKSNNDISKLHASSDQKLIRLFAEACKAGRQSRARGIAQRLHLLKSVDGAWKLANKLKMPALAEEMRRISERRSEMEEGEEAGKENAKPSFYNEQDRVQHDQLHGKRFATHLDVAAAHQGTSKSMRKSNPQDAGANPFAKD